jgi:hypothetical protein
MAIKTATKAQTGVQPKGTSVGLYAWASSYTATASLSAGDVIQMCKIPQRNTVIFLAVSGGSGTGSINVGDGVSPARYISGLSMTTTTAYTVINTQYVPYSYSTDDTIDITVSAVTTGTAAGTINLFTITAMDP